jgi:hypothetical protein
MSRSGAEWSLERHADLVAGLPTHAANTTRTIGIDGKVERAGNVRSSRHDKAGSACGEIEDRAVDSFIVTGKTDRPRFQGQLAWLPPSFQDGRSPSRASFGTLGLRTIWKTASRIRPVLKRRFLEGAIFLRETTGATSGA